MTGPGVVSNVEPESAHLDVSTADTDLGDLCGADLGVGGWATQLVLTLLLVNSTTTTRGPALVPPVPADTHYKVEKLKTEASGGGTRTQPLLKLHCGIRTVLNLP